MRDHFPGLKAQGKYIFLEIIGRDEPTALVLAQDRMLDSHTIWRVLSVGPEADGCNIRVGDRALVNGPKCTLIPVDAEEQRYVCCESDGVIATLPMPSEVFPFAPSPLDQPSGPPGERPLIVVPTPGVPVPVSRRSVRRLSS
jgi:hypothetical protein